MQTLRLRGLRAGEEYTVPIRIRKVLEIKEKHNLFFGPASTWVLKRSETIPTEQTLIVRKNPLVHVHPYSPDIVPISRRNARPVDPAAVQRLVEEVRAAQSVAADDYLILDYGLETNRLGRFYMNLWWFPHDCKIYQTASTWRPTLRNLERSHQSYFFTPTNIIHTIIGGHESMTQVGGPDLRFAWERQRHETRTNAPRTTAPTTVAPSTTAPRTRSTVYSNIRNIGTLRVPAGAVNVIAGEEIQEGDEMVNFQGEMRLEEPRYYKKNTFNSLPLKISHKYKENPYTRATMIPNKTFRRYRARIYHPAAAKTATSTSNKKTPSKRTGHKPWTRPSKAEGRRKREKATARRQARLEAEATTAARRGAQTNTGAATAAGTGLGTTTNH